MYGAERAIEIASARKGTSVFMDVDLVKDVAVSYALEKVYCKYDVDHEGASSISGFLYRVVFNCVMSELKKEGTLAGKKDVFEGDKLSDNALSVLFNDPEVEEKSRKREELIQDMLACMKKLQPVDQVILKCWMLFKRGDYTREAIEELGWEDTPRTRNVVNVRCTRAFDTLRGMMMPMRELYVSTIIRHACRKRENRPIGRMMPDGFVVDQNYLRRRRRAARKSVTGRIDYRQLSQILSSALPEQ